MVLCAEIPRFARNDGCVWHCSARASIARQERAMFGKRASKATVKIDKSFQHTKYYPEKRILKGIFCLDDIQRFRRTVLFRSY
jgi:hypothetical protein